MEAVAVFGGYPVPIPLCFAQFQPYRCQLFICSTGIHSGLYGQMRLGHRLAGSTLQFEVIVMDGLHPGNQRFLALIMALEAGCFDRL